MREDLKIVDTGIRLPRAFLKFGKKEYMEKYIEKGELRFAPAYEFSRMEVHDDKIADKYEGALFYPIYDFYAAPLMSTDHKGNDVYGVPFKVADKAKMSWTTPRIQSIPFHCLYCYDKPITGEVIKLDNYEQIICDFPDYDTVVFIYRPDMFLEKVKEVSSIYANYIKYVDCTMSESEVETFLHCLYYKRKIFGEQKEFRICLPELSIEEPKIYNIGPLADIAFLIPLKKLKNGIVLE